MHGLWPEMQSLGASALLYHLLSGCLLPVVQIWRWLVHQQCLQCQLLSTCSGSRSVSGSAGINTAIYSPSGGSAGVGFAIPIDLVKSSVEQILQFGKVLRPVLGISFATDQSSAQVSAP